MGLAPRPSWSLIYGAAACLAWCSLSADWREVAGEFGQLRSQLRELKQALEDYPRMPWYLGRHAQALATKAANHPWMSPDGHQAGLEIAARLKAGEPGHTCCQSLFQRFYRGYRQEYHKARLAYREAGKR